MSRMITLRAVVDAVQSHTWRCVYQVQCQVSVLRDLLLNYPMFGDAGGED